MKNCLAIIGAVLELVEPELSTCARSRYARARVAAERIRILLDEDLVPQAPEPLHDKRYVDIAALVTGVVSALQDRADARRVQLSCASAGGRVQGDSEQLTEALINLTTNSIEATRPGGHVTVSSRITDEGDQEVVIEDSGEGMCPEILARVGQLHATNREGGSGLGVAVAQETVARHGGILNYSSRVDEGTVVTLWLPGD